MARAGKELVVWILEGVLGTRSVLTWDSCTGEVPLYITKRHISKNRGMSEECQRQYILGDPLGLWNDTNSLQLRAIHKSNVRQTPCIT